MKTIYKQLLFLMFVLPFSAMAQNILSGTVVDSKTNQPIPGVNVNVQGANNGTSTDFDGKFKITKINAGDRLVFSFIGYTNQTVAYSSQKTLTVNLVEEANKLQEVVVQVGYGTVKKKDATGSVSVLSGKDFNKGANVTTENLLNGRIAGVTVNTSGAPGSGSEIRIRGGSSIGGKEGGSNDPLIVIDGLPVDNRTNTGSTSFLASLNPATVESITVLKDASATAIYGSRASNGVILITTKKGGKKLEVDYNFQYGSGRLVKTVDVFNADQFRNVIAQRSPGLLSTLGTANTDWQKEIYRRTDFVDNNISIRGNLFSKIPTRLTVGNTYQEGLRLTNNFNRSTVSLALSPSFFKDHLKFRVNANYANEKNRFAPNVENSAVRFDPTQPVYNPSSPWGGFFEYSPQGGGAGIPGLADNAPRNPVAQLLQTNENGISNRFFGNFEVDYKFHFFPALRFVANVGFDEGTGERTKTVPSNSAVGGNNLGVVFGNNEFSRETFRNKLADVYFNYSKAFGKLNFDATAGYSYQKFEKTRFQTGNTNGPQSLNTAAPVEIDPDLVLIGFFGRTNLSYNDRFLLTLVYRRDASSRFSKEIGRWGDFPAASFAWKLKNDFFKESKTISDLKLRAGWGITGQQDTGIEKFGYLERYKQGLGNSQYFIGNTAYGVAVPAKRTFIKWENTTTYNAGLDFGLFNNRISGSVDAFYKLSDDLLLDAPNADGTNFTNTSFQNIGSMKTRGVEVNVNADVVRHVGTGFNWNVNVNFTKFERRIVEINPFDKIVRGDIDSGTGGQIQVLQPGFTPDSFYVYKQLYDPAGNPIEGAFADLNGDNLINISDRYIYKNTDPDFVFGFASNVNYKNIDFSFNLRANIGSRIYNNVKSNFAAYDRLKPGAVAANILTAVTDTNFLIGDESVYSDLYIENASFLRMDNITLGYTFPKWLEGKASLRLFSGVQNAFVITKYSGLDPEITGGIDKSIYPRQRTLLFGANVKF